MWLQAKEEARKLQAQRGGPLFKPVMHRVGWLGLFGKLVPSKRFYQDKIAECEWSIDREREDVFANGISRAYFVVFETQVCCDYVRVRCGNGPPHACCHACCELWLVRCTASCRNGGGGRGYHALTCDRRSQREGG